MEVDLSYYLHCPTLTLNEAAKILAGLEPKEHCFSLKQGYGPVKVPDYEPELKAKCYKAVTMMQLLLQELKASDCQLEIVDLFAIVCGDSARKRNIVVSDQPVAVEDCPSFDLLSTRLDAFNSRDFVIHKLGEIKYLQVNNPPEYVKEELITGRLESTEFTTVTTLSLARWASQKGIDSVFSAMLNTDQGQYHYTEAEVPYLLSELVRINSDFLGKEFNIHLSTMSELCENGSQGGSTKQYVTKFLYEKFRIESSSEQGKRLATSLGRRDAKPLNMSGQSVITEPFAEYIANKEKAAKSQQEKERHKRAVLSKR